jgi:hypothetical protein
VVHLLTKLLDASEGDFPLILDHFEVDRRSMAADVARLLDRLESGNAQTPSLSPDLVALLREAWVFGSIDYSASEVRTGFLVFALLDESGSARLVRDSIRELKKIDPTLLRRDFLQIVRGSNEDPVEGTVAPAARAAAVHRRLVFISYRRADTNDLADRLVDRIKAEVKDIEVWRDEDTMMPGVVFSDAIDRAIAAADIVLVLIGKKWLTATDEQGARRIQGEDDFVRREIAAAFRQKKYVVPCLIGGARMPRAEELPAELAELPSRHGIKIAPARFRKDTTDLIELLRGFSPTASPEKRSPPP